MGLNNIGSGQSYISSDSGSNSGGGFNSGAGNFISSAQQLVTEKLNNGGLNTLARVGEKTSGMTSSQAKEFRKLLNEQLIQMKLQQKQLQKQLDNDTSLSAAERTARQKEIDRMTSTINQVQKETGVQWDAASDAIQKTLINLYTQFNQTVQTVVNDVKSYQAQVNTRLQGLSDTIDQYGDMSYEITKTFGANMLISEQTLLKNLNDAVSRGIAVDIEQRAFLQTIKEDIAQTFDAFDSNLTRLIRLQSQNTTAERLGMESALNETLNTLFQDSSYLSDIKTSTISGLLLEAESTMSGTEATQFEFAVQKWLGGLYSEGMSSTAITALATALGQLGSGNITGMSTEMQNLLAMGASLSGGKSFSELLSDGLSASSVNTLMKGVVEYLEDISTSTNNVVKLAQGSVFGMSTSDLKAASNISGSIGALYGTSADMLGQLVEGVGNMSEVMGYTGQYSNLKDNLMYSAANMLTLGNGIPYLIYSTINDLGNMLDVAIPTISAAGFSMSFEGTKVSEIVQAALGGLGLIGSAVSLVSSWANGGSFHSIDTSWYLPSGTDLSSLSTTGLSVGTSKTYTQGSGNDISAGATGDAIQDAEETSGQEIQSAPDTTTDDVCESISELYTSLFVNRRPILVDINSFPEEMQPLKVTFPDEETPTVRVMPGDESIPVVLDDDTATILSGWRGV